MKCLSEDTLIQLALESPGNEDALAASGNSNDSLSDGKAHLENCEVCREELECFQAISASLQALHQLFDFGHEADRRRLLAALSDPEISSERARQNSQQQIVKRSVFMRRVSVGFITATLIALMCAVLWVPQSSTLFAQVVEQLGQTKSVRFKIKNMEMKRKVATVVDERVYYWSPPNSMRCETREDGEVIEEIIQTAGKPGVKIDHRQKTFRKLPLTEKPDLLLTFMEGLSKYAGQPDRDLGTGTVDGQQVRIFEVEADKIQRDCAGMDARFWFNPVSKLPVAIELHMNEAGAFMRWEDFQWGESDEEWFKINIPEAYREYTWESDKVEEFTKRCVTAFKVYAKYSHNKYPPVDIINGDTTRDELFKNAGIPVVPRTNKEVSNPIYGECLRAQLGLSNIHMIQHQNPDSEYYGRTVGPDDKNKVLLRWKLDNEQYRVIYGDLHYENVSADALSQLEGQK